MTMGIAFQYVIYLSIPQRIGEEFMPNFVKIAAQRKEMFNVELAKEKILSTIPITMKIKRQRKINTKHHNFRLSYKVHLFVTNFREILQKKKRF